MDNAHTEDYADIPSRTSIDRGSVRDDVDSMSSNKETGHGSRTSIAMERGSVLFGINPMRLLPNTKKKDFTLAEVLAQPQPEPVTLLTVGNVLWVVLFGWWLCLGYTFVSLFMYLTIVGRPYGRLCWKLKSYFLWPFGKYITREINPSRNSSFTFRTFYNHNPENSLTENGPSQDEESNGEDKTILNAPSDSFQVDRLHGCLNITAYVIWLITGGLIVNILHVFSFILCWWSIVFIPMAKVNQVALTLNVTKPLEIDVSVGHRITGGEILLCTYQATNYNYYRYSVHGLNVVLVNLLPFVALTLVLGYAVPDKYLPHPVVLFIFALLSISPIAYYIGMAVASIAAQTNFAIGAMLTAIFGVSIEIILYSIAIYKGGLIQLIQAGCVGSLLGDLLLLPGLSMIFGGIKYHEQKFSSSAAGVSSMLLIVSIIGAFTPTILWTVGGETTFSCEACIMSHNSTTIPLACDRCHSTAVDFEHNEAFKDTAQPLSYAVAGILPLAYLVGLLFTLKTHSHIFSNMEEGEHDAPNWSKLKATVVLAVSIILFALVAEELVKSIEPTIESLGINQAFAGVTVMALVPSSAEYVNAIGFALQNNVALSLEIGAASAVQICLLMLPFLIGFSGIVDGSTSLLMFPMFYVFAVVFAVVIVNYLSIEGTSNYFRGVALVVSYCLFITGFYFLDVREEEEGVK